MLKIYNDEVFVIELEEFQANPHQTLTNIESNPDYDKMVLLIQENKKVVAATSLWNFLKKDIIFKTFSDNEGGVFFTVKEYCLKNRIPYDTYFPVLNEVGECEYLLHYIEDKVFTKLFPEGGRTEVISEYSLESYENVLDYFLVQNFDVYIFSEIEEYTYIIISWTVKSSLN